MRALVTGSAGYIGSHLCKRLKEDGWGVVGLDVRRALSPYVDHHITASLVDRTALATSLRYIDFDVVFHLGALIDVADGERRPLDYYRTNLGGTLNMIDFSEGKPIVFSSTAAVYASSPDPLSETSRIAPENVYGETKSSAERVATRMRVSRSRICSSRATGSTSTRDATGDNSVLSGVGGAAGCLIDLVGSRAMAAVQARSRVMETAATYKRFRRFSQADRRMGAPGSARCQPHGVKVCRCTAGDTPRIQRYNGCCPHNPTLRGDSSRLVCESVLHCG